MISLQIKTASNVEWSRWFKLADRYGNPASLVGASMLMHVRKTALSATIDATLSTENGRLAIDTLVPGRFMIALPKLAAGSYVFDIVRNDGGTDRPFLEGTIKVKDGVTR